MFAIMHAMNRLTHYDLRTRIVNNVARGSSRNAKSNNEAAIMN